jgi:hypothetical protein
MSADIGTVLVILVALALFGVAALLRGATAIVRGWDALADGRR